MVPQISLLVLLVDLIEVIPSPPVRRKRRAVGDRRPTRIGSS